jgi:nitrogen fixation protein FixH
MSASPVASRAFTGRHMAIIMVCFFMVVIGVNLTMAILASKSWTGLVVQSSYVASQHFNSDTAKREAQLARGYELSISYADGHIKLVAKDKAGQALPASSAVLQLFRRSNGAPLRFVCSNGQCITEVELSPGLWRGDLQMSLGGQDAWLQAIEILVKEK